MRVKKLEGVAAWKLVCGLGLGIYIEQGAALEKKLEPGRKACKVNKTGFGHLLSSQLREACDCSLSKP